MISGTSYSSPLVAGLSSLLYAQNPNRTFEEIYDLITEHAEDQVGFPSEDIQGFDKYHGHGRINAYNSLLAGKMSSDELEFEETTLAVYPNPSTGVFTINAPNTIHQINIYNNNGALISKKMSQITLKAYVILTFLNNPIACT